MPTDPFVPSDPNARPRQSPPAGSFSGRVMLSRSGTSPTIRNAAPLSFGLNRRPLSPTSSEPPENRFTVLDPEVLVIREARVGLGCDAGQVVLQVGHERAALHRQADLFPVPSDGPLILRPGDELARSAPVELESARHGHPASAASGRAPCRRDRRIPRKDLDASAVRGP